MRRRDLFIYGFVLDSTVVVGMNTSQLVILGLKPEDSHNYTCTPTGKRGYTHNVLGKTNLYVLYCA